jgi:hypothetical protein
MRNDARGHGLSRARMGIAAPTGVRRPRVRRECPGALETDDHACVLYSGPRRSLVPLLAEALHIGGGRGYLVEMVDGGPDASARPSSCYREWSGHLEGLRGALDDHGAPPPVHARGETTWLLHAGCDAVETAGRTGAARTGPRSSSGSHVLLCLYDVQRLPGSVIVDILRTHPKVVTGRLLLDNPYFAAPAAIPEMMA